MDTEERVPAQHFHIPVVEIKGLVRSCGRSVDRKFVIGRIRGHEVEQCSDADKMPMNGDLVMGDVGIVSASGEVEDSDGGDWGV